MSRDNPNKQKNKTNTQPEKQKKSEGTDIEFSEEFVDVHERETEARSNQKLKGIQSNPFYRNG